MFDVFRKLAAASLDQILHFDLYRIALKHTLSLESEDSEFLKTMQGIQTWLERNYTFETFNYSLRNTSWNMSTLVDESPVTYNQWKIHVADNRDVIKFIYYYLFKDIEPTEQPLEVDMDALRTQFEGIDTT